MLNQQEEEALFKEVKGGYNFSPSTEDEPLLVGEPEERLGGNGLEKAENSFVNNSSLHESSWSVKVRHSKLYAAATVAQLVIATGLIVWVALDHYAVHNPWFVFLELILMISIVFDTILQIHYQGIPKFFCNKESSNNQMDETKNNDLEEDFPDVKYSQTNQQDEVEATSRTAAILVSKDGAFSRFFRNYGFLIFNYGQLLLAGFCIFGFVSTTAGGAANWEEDVGLGLLLVRYIALLVFFAMNHYRSISIQGGLFKACCSKETVDADWDVKF